MDERRRWKTVVLVALAVVLVQAAIGAAIYFSFGDWLTRASFGESFGVVSALFSGLAFAGLIYAILLQREDLALQREELKLTREELKRSAIAQEQSEIALRTQADAAAQSAKLSATNYLLDHYKSELTQYHGHAISSVDPRHSRLQELRRRQQVLVQMLDALFENLTKQQ